MAFKKKNGAKGAVRPEQDVFSLFGVGNLFFSCVVGGGERKRTQGPPQVVKGLAKPLHTLVFSSFDFSTCKIM